MLRIGIVGAENSHTVAIAKTINLDGLVPDARVVGVWGETSELAKAASERGGIPTVVETPEAFIGMVDGVVVDHRHASEHLPAAEALLEAGLPLFIDKPFCYRVEEGIAFLRRAKQRGVPVTSFSTVPKQGSFLTLSEKIADLGAVYSVTTTGPCDIHSQWGGVFFYGIHQVDMLLRIAGYDASEAFVFRGAGKDHEATVRFESGCVAVMHLIGSASPVFHVSVIGEKGRVDQEIGYDANPYLASIQRWVEMFRTGVEPETVEEILGPVALLEALEASVQQGVPVRGCCPYLS
ncbi:MAG: Gfo/Idh/MocA family oxidoreductase [candidate division Zixibacteria bacterium]|nr:Gfo/Idh/MocA family oxidoreductase [candidate division Zixibacteria bacterium]